MFISEALAQTAETAATTGSLGGTVLQLVLIFVIFYVLLIRPQQKKIKQHEAILSVIKKGDKVITGGGVYATVLDASDPVDVKVELAPGVEVFVNRGTIRDVVTDMPATPKATAKAKAPANSNKKASKTKK